MKTTAILAASALLSLASCGGDGGEVISGPYPPQGGGASPMEASAWSFGPVINGRNYSVGMPSHPTSNGDGSWSFNVPERPGSVHYVTMPSGSLAGKSRIVLHYRLEAADGVTLSPTKYPQMAPSLSLYFQRAGDDWSGTGQYETYRWWATFAAVMNLTPGEGEIVAPLDGKWTAVQTSSATTNRSAFDAAKANAAVVGFTFGGGDGWGHGVSASGPAKFTVLDFRIE